MSSTNQVVLFFGAGASAWAGYQTFLNFPGMFWPSGNEPAKLEITDKERGILDEIKAHLAKKHLSPTLDSYLAAIHEFKEFTNSSVSQTILRDRLLTNSTQWANTLELRHLLMTIRDRVCRLTASHYRGPFADASLPRLAEVYAFFSTLMGASGFPLKLFTTNYDIVPEYLFSKNPYFVRKRGSDLSPPFVFQNGFPNFDDADLTSNTRPTFSDQLLDPRQGSGNEPALLCYRLHGCVAWLREGLKESRIFFDLSRPGQVPHFAEKLCVSYPGHEERYGLPPHATAYRALAHSVSQASLLIFVGFSFRDAEVVSVIGRALHEAENAGRTLARLVVVDPQLTNDEVNKRIKECLYQIAGPCVDWRSLDTTVLSESFPNPGLADRVLRL